MVKNREFFNLIRSSFVLLAVCVLVMGFAIPTATSLIAETIDPGAANGSQININGTIYGSYYLAQAFNQSYFFQPRPSAIAYNQTASGSPGCSPNTNQSLNQTLSNINQFENMNPNVTISKIPGEVVMDSASGLDPNIPLNAAKLEQGRVIKSIYLLSEEINRIVSEKSITSFVMNLVNNTEQQDFPIFGSFYVNVMTLDVGILEFMLQNGIIQQSQLS